MKQKVIKTAKKTNNKEKYSLIITGKTTGKEIIDIVSSLPNKKWSIIKHGDYTTNIEGTLITLHTTGTINDWSHSHVSIEVDRNLDTDSMGTFLFDNKELKILKLKNRLDLFFGIKKSPKIIKEMLKPYME